MAKVGNKRERERKKVVTEWKGQRRVKKKNLDRTKAWNNATEKEKGENPIRVTKS